MEINLRNILLQTFKDYIENNPESKLAKKYTLEQFEKATEILQVGEAALRKACNQTIDLCAENAKIEIRSNYGRFEKASPDKSDCCVVKDFIGRNYPGHGDCTYEVVYPNQQSILNTKNQII